MKRWTLVACAVGIVFFAIALSNTVYELTSPPALSWHVLLRKIYSVVAFSIVGYALRRALDEYGVRRSIVLTTVAVGVYSGLIEWAQFLEGSQEGRVWNTIDIACGALGGAIGDALTRRARARPPR